MEYRFYIQRYEQSVWNASTKEYETEEGGELIDIEEFFHCKYVKLEGLSENGKIRNIYMESFAEEESSRLHIPKDILHESTNVALTLLFPIVNNNVYDVQDNERAFYDYVKGRKIEYNDTFRNRYATLILIDKPEMVSEVLYGESRYRQVRYTFKNIYGKSYTEPTLRGVFVLDVSSLDTEDYLGN